MKTPPRALPLLSLLIIAFAYSTSGQGDLTPPGAPAPTMKSLDQIEARRPIDPTQPGFSTPYTISNPGSYYLTGNLAVTAGDAIVIAVDGVTLDLNGFTLSSTESTPTGNGVFINGARRDIQILNGHITGNVSQSGGTYSGSGFAGGISYKYPAPMPLSVRVTGVSVSGCSTYGIDLSLGNSTVVEACTVQTVGSNGIVASSVSNSTSLECGGFGILATAADNCYGYGIGNGTGLFANTAQNCYGFGSGNGTGLSATTAQNCYGYSSGAGYGINAFLATNCYAGSNSGVGLSANNAINCYGLALGNGTGLSANNASNSYGTCTGGTGLSATTALNCFGASTSGTGIICSIATNCSASSDTSTALYAARNANSCYGTSRTGISIHALSAAFLCNSTTTEGPIGIQTCLAIGCTTNGGSIDTCVNGKFLGTP